MNSERAAQAMRRLRDEPNVVLPSLLLCDFGNLERELASLEEAGVKALHLDVMDGQFVPNLTYGMPIVEGIRRLTDLPVDVHLMISKPSDYVRQFVDAGADCLTIHAEIEEDHGEVLETIASMGVGAGLAINPDTPLESVETELPLCDLLLIMSVNAGFGGQKFNPIALDKLKSVKDRSLVNKSGEPLLLEVDGGINLETISGCYEAGATLFVVGSAIFGKEDYRVAVEGLQQALQ